jgi:threonine/homoserine/homoserine lactone efflux protein
MNVLAICVMALVFGFVGSMPLAGPIAILAVARATRGRYGEALRVGLGAAVAEGIYAAVSFWGFTTFLARHAIVVPISHGTTAIVLVGVGVRFAVWRPNEGATKAPENKAGTLLFGFTVSAVNPTLLLTWSAAAAFLYSRGLHEPSPLYAIPFGVCAAAGISGWFLTLTALFKKYGTKVPRAGLTWVVRSMGLLLVVLGLWSGVKLVRYLEGTNTSASSAPRARMLASWTPGARPSRSWSTAPTTTT